MTENQIYEDIKNALQKMGAVKIDFYILINNDGYTFTKDGRRYDLRHWRNVYGVECDNWGCHTVGRMPTEEEKAFCAEVAKIANELNQ